MSIGGVIGRVLLESSPPTVTLGGFELPTEPAAFFDCWADAYREDSASYETVDHQCSTDDYIFVSDELVSGQLWFYHRLLTSDELNPFQFATLYTNDFHRTFHGMGGSESATSRASGRSRENPRFPSSATTMSAIG